MRDLPDAAASARNPILRRMIRANDDYWDSDRATYEDELGAWRERTAVAVAVAASDHPIRDPPLNPPASRPAAARDTRPGIHPRTTRPTTSP